MLVKSKNIHTLSAVLLSLTSSLSMAMSDPEEIKEVPAEVLDFALDGIVNCTDYNAINQTPDFTFPQEESFDHFSSRITANSTPYHMGHDKVVTAGQPTTIIGKFDYGSVLHKDLEDEKVRAYISGTGKTSWDYIGEFTTNSDGKIFVPVDGQTEGEYKVRMVVMGDLTFTDAYVTAIEPGKKAVVFDIDETLTVSDLEQILDYTGVEAADARPAAGVLVNEYIDRGYYPVFITARSYWYAKGSRAWLRNTLNLPEFTLRTTFSNETGLNAAAEYKTEVINEMKDAGMEFFRAYGNADTDAEAFINAGIPLSNTYIIGDKAGIYDTVAITDPGYEAHISDVVLNTAHSGCQ